MAKGLDDIIAQLMQQSAAIERALAALREVEGVTAPVAAASSSSVNKASPTKRTGGMTPEGRKRLSAALRKRWAAKKAAEGTSGVTAKKSATRKVRITPEGRERLAEAMKRRWAVKRAGSAVKSAGTKKRAGKKAA